MAKKITLLLLCFCLQSLAQTPKASAPEFLWALGHPFAAIKIKKITKKCNSLISLGKINSADDAYSNGGKKDAFRHCFYMAAFAQKIKVRKIRKLGKAHERTNYRQFLKSKTEEGEIADSLGSVMDLYNNELGFILGSEHKKITLEELSLLVVNDIKNGKALIMKRDKEGNYLDCSGKKIDLGLYKGKWFVPKCLVGSDN